MPDFKVVILDKSKERFERFGYKKTTMDEISKDCRISKKTLYEHFNNKENLFTCLILREASVARSIIFASTKGIDDPIDQLKRLVPAAVRYFNEDNFLTRLLRDEVALYSVVNTRKYRYQMIEDTINAIAEIIELGKGLGVFREVDDKIVAYAIFKLVESFSYMRMIDFSQEKAHQGYYTDVLFEFVINALVKKGYD